MTDFKFLHRPSINKDKKSPAFILLHGYGSNETDLYAFADYLPSTFHIFSLRAPQSLEWGGFAWYDIFLDSRQNKISDDLTAMQRVLDLSNFTKKLIAEYHLDENNINLLGFSQGAILSYALALNYPGQYRKIIALSGYINENIMPVNEDFSRYKNLDFFVSHGLYDDIIPIELARKISPYLQERNIKHLYKEYAMGHEVNNECFNDFIAWLDSFSSN